MNEMNEIFIRCVAVKYDSNGDIDSLSMTTTIPSHVPHEVAYNIIEKMGIYRDFPYAYIDGGLTFDCIRYVWCFTLKVTSGGIDFGKLEYYFFELGKSFPIPDGVQIYY